MKHWISAESHLSTSIAESAALSVEKLTLRVQGLDAVNGSPVIDIKPVFAEFVPDRASVRQPAWSHEMMINYFKRLT
jgi:tRNA (Thr-GGU) A37 N-methylase